MGQKAITIYTPSTEEAHITAKDDAQIHRGIFGNSYGIMRCDEKLACTIEDSTHVKLASGAFMHKGYIHVIPKGESLELDVASGTVGLYRYDYIVSEFIRGDESTADTLQFKVITGDASSTKSGAQLPQNKLTSGDIAGSDAASQVPIYYITIEGDTITKVTQICEDIKIGEGDVPETRKINGHALTSDITLTASDVGAYPNTKIFTAANVSLSYSDVGAVPVTRTVNGYALSSNVDLYPSDVHILYYDSYDSLPDVSTLKDGTICLVPLNTTA